MRGLARPLSSPLEWACSRRCGTAATGRAMAERSRRIIRQWDREIEDETRRAAARGRAGGRWRAVSWTALWLLWLALLLALVARVRGLG